MDPHLQEWLNLTLRWFHLVVGIAWIGSSFYFMWLDATLTAPSPVRAGVEGELWMVHSGGFYQVEKRLIRPGDLPPVLHWFKWEAALTWISGMLLLVTVYYLTGGAFLGDARVTAPTPWLSAVVGLLSIGIGWHVYDGIWRLKASEEHPAVANAICALLLAGLAYGLCRWLGGRAAYVHVGATLGTIMVANVWARILPAQRKMIAATEAGTLPDYELGKRAKRRSVHNSYVTLPVLFMMLSNHFPSTYGHELNWIVLILMIAVGALVRHAMIVRVRRQPGAWVLWPAAALIVGLIWWTAPHRASPRGDAAAGDAPAATPGEVTAPDAPLETVAMAIVARRCQPCHAATPTDATFAAAPNGVVFATAADVRRLAERVRVRAIDQQTMPLANKTGMSAEERSVLNAWLASGRP
jgi:uncharacterized membrane protein